MEKFRNILILTDWDIFVTFVDIKLKLYIMSFKVKFIVSFKLCNSEKELLPALSESFEDTLKRFLLPYHVHFEHPHRRTKSASLFAVYTIELEAHKPEIVYYLGKLIEGEAGVLQLFDAGIESFSFQVVS